MTEPGFNGWKCLEMAGNGWKGLEISENVSQWLEMTGMARNGWKWLKKTEERKNVKKKPTKFYILVMLTYVST